MGSQVEGPTSTPTSTAAASTVTASRRGQDELSRKRKRPTTIAGSDPRSGSGSASRSTASMRNAGMVVDPDWDEVDTDMSTTMNLQTLTNLPPPPVSSSSSHHRTSDPGQTTHLVEQLREDNLAKDEEIKKLKELIKKIKDKSRSKSKPKSKADNSNASARSSSPQVGERLTPPLTPLLDSVVPLALSSGSAETASTEAVGPGDTPSRRPASAESTSVSTSKAMKTPIVEKTTSKPGSKSKPDKSTAIPSTPTSTSASASEELNTTPRLDLSRFETIPVPSLRNLSVGTAPGSTGRKPGSVSGQRKQKGETKCGTPNAPPVRDELGKTKDAEGASKSSTTAKTAAASTSPAKPKATLLFEPSISSSSTKSAALLFSTPSGTSGIEFEKPTTMNLPAPRPTTKSAPSSASPSKTKSLPRLSTSDSTSPSVPGPVPGMTPNASKAPSSNPASTSASVPSLSYPSPTTPVTAAIDDDDDDIDDIPLSSFSRKNLGSGTFQKSKKPTSSTSLPNPLPAVQPQSQSNSRPTSGLTNPSPRQGKFNDVKVKIEDDEVSVLRGDALKAKNTGRTSGTGVYIDLTIDSDEECEVSGKGGEGTKDEEEEEEEEEDERDELLPSEPPESEPDDELRKGGDGEPESMNVDGVECAGSGGGSSGAEIGDLRSREAVEKEEASSLKYPPEVKREQASPRAVRVKSEPRQPEVSFAPTATTSGNDDDDDDIMEIDEEEFRRGSMKVSERESERDTGVSTSSGQAQDQVPLPPSFEFALTDVMLPTPFPVLNNGDGGLEHEGYRKEWEERRVEYVERCDEELRANGYDLRVKHLQVAVYPVGDEWDETSESAELVARDGQGAHRHKMLCILCLDLEQGTSFDQACTPLDIARHAESEHPQFCERILKASDEEIANTMEQR
ncbi:hypothetical protein K435DRAFT_867431 [Dendrothele bispora CBS 962.96]|uniref:Uncharacterized protein n=1 Tax=Dendrothele bispora (strain CBS 962.96) TaxID=1314807 RepID=A0A4S8LE76_DENBC|nr:hypothetical protein K435DRAFT_867431 [Dendrothele bispora CBS 962.96]